MTAFGLSVIAGTESITSNTRSIAKNDISTELYVSPIDFTGVYNITNAVKNDTKLPDVILPSKIK